MWLFLFSAWLVLFADVPVPYLTGPVVDEAKLLSTPELARAGEAVEELNRTGLVQMAVLTVSSLHGYDIEGYSIAVAERWKLGKQRKDNGLILIIAPHERRMRIEVGYGLEGRITDAFSRQILDDYVRPLLRERRFADGIIAACSLIAKKLGAAIAEPTVVAESKRPSPWLPLLILLGFGGLFMLPFLMHAVGRHRRGYRGTRVYDDWGGFGRGYGGGGFGGFSGGGGGFGGGGASSSW